MKNLSIAPNKFAFVYLVKQDEKTWNETMVSLTLLANNLLAKMNCIYKVILFTEGEPSQKIMSKLKNLKKKLSIKLIFKRIDLKEYVKRKIFSCDIMNNFPNPAHPLSYFSLGYRDMCAFFSYYVFFDIELDAVDYFVRVDTDSFFLDIDDSFINQLETMNADYGYLKNTVQLEDKAVSVGFGHHLHNFIQDHNLFDSVSDDWVDICIHSTQSPLMYYTNFEIVKISWARSDLHVKFLESIINALGIYKHRWGDALIRYYLVHILNAEVIELDSCLYKHSGLYDSRNTIRKYITKLYLKLLNKSHSNCLELDTSSIDDLIIGLKNP